MLIKWRQILACVCFSGICFFSHTRAYASQCTLTPFLFNISLRSNTVLRNPSRDILKIIHGQNDSHDINKIICSFIWYDRPHCVQFIPFYTLQHVSHMLYASLYTMYTYHTLCSLMRNAKTQVPWARIAGIFGSVLLAMIDGVIFWQWYACLKQKDKEIEKYKRQIAVQQEAHYITYEFRYDPDIALNVAEKNISMPIGYKVHRERRLFEESVKKYERKTSIEMPQLTTSEYNLLQKIQENLTVQQIAIPPIQEYRPYYASVLKLLRMYTSRSRAIYTDAVIVCIMGLIIKQTLHLLQ